GSTRRRSAPRRRTPQPALRTGRAQRRKCLSAWCPPQDACFGATLYSFAYDGKRLVDGRTCTVAASMQSNRRCRRGLQQLLCRAPDAAPLRRATEIAALDELIDRLQGIKRRVIGEGLDHRRRRCPHLLVRRHSHVTTSNSLALLWA